MKQSGKITSLNIETYMHINQCIMKMIRDVLTFNQVVTSINENIALAQKQAEIINSNQIDLLFVFILIILIYLILKNKDLIMF
jgi:hypothetical protein